MKKRISIEEIEGMIKEKLKQNGVLEVISQEKISEIKNKIKDILENGKKLDEQESEAKPVQTVNPNVSLKTTEDPEKTEIIKKETELDIKEKELINKEIELEDKEKALEDKQQEMSYKPELPEVLRNIKPGEIIVFDTNELSLGFENLSNRKFRLKSDPDDKKSIKDLWLLSAITKTDVYKIELKKIGELDFNPYEGTTEFKNATELNADFSENDIESIHSVQSAVNSQMPDKEQEMLDSVEPIKNVTQPLMNVSDLEKEKFENNFKEVITKIVSDQLNKISSETTKKNIFSL
jgi:hypothetical protein